MPITARQIAEDQLLIDFDRPVQPLGISSSMLEVPGFTVTAVAFQTHTAEVRLSRPIETTEELWVQYYGTPQIYFISGSIANATPEIVQPFEVLATVWGIAQYDPRVFEPDSTSEVPTIGDFIEAFGLREAIEITNPDNRDAQSPDELKFLRALEDAEALWQSELYSANAGALLVLNPGKRRTLLTFARYFLDSTCPRKHVIAAYEEAIRNIRAVSGTLGQVTLDPFTGTDDYFYMGNKHCGSCSPCGQYGSTADSFYDVYRRL